MEETRISTAKLSTETPVFFTPHRRRHLKSDTVCTLLRIFSQCYDESCASRNLITDHDTESGSHEQVCKPDALAYEKVPEVNSNGEEKGSEDGRSGEQMVINQIEQLMGLEENENSLNQKDSNLGSFSEQMLIDELENIVQGNEDVGRENNAIPLKDPLIQSQSGATDSPSTKGKHVTFQLIDLSRNVTQTLECPDNEGNNQSLLSINPARNSVSESNNSIISVFGNFDVAENHTQAVSDEINVSVEKIAVVEISNYKDDDKRSTRTKDNDDLKNTGCDGDVVDIGNPTTEGIEDGEISGGYSMDDISMDMLLQDPKMQNKQVNDEPMNDGNELLCNESDLEDSFFCVDVVDKTVNLSGLWESDRNKAVYTPDGVLHEKTLADAIGPMIEAQPIKMENSNGNRSLLVYGDILEEDAAEFNKISTEKNVEIRPKRNRGSVSKEKKAKKKAKDRKKRAEKNKQLGVRRLKLHMVSKPKPIQYCRHYLHGRCQEGDKCNFSHDTVPLTKSKPCCHFARHSCMKGDDCPFDHQLSKYPCSNLSSRGFCSRGDDCMFSHKVLSAKSPVTASNVKEPEKNFASLVCDSTSKKQQSNDVSSFSAKMHSHKSIGKSSNETVLKQCDLVDKGTTFLSVGNSSLVDKVKQQNLLCSGSTEVKAGNHNIQRGSETVHNSNELLSRTPPVGTPKGMNFLSFGSAQRDGLSDSKLASSISSGGNGVKLSAFGNSNMPNQSISSPFSDSNTKGVQSALVSKGINFLSFGGVQRDYSSGGKLTISFSSGDNGGKLSALDISNMPNQPGSVLLPDLIPKGIQPPVAPKGISFLSLGNTSTKMTSQTSSADSTTKGIQHVLPNGVNFLPFGKTSIDNSSNKGKAKLTEDGTDGIDGRVKVKQNALYEPPKSCSNSSALTSFPISLIQSWGHSTSKFDTATPNSAQKAIFSTLAFAARYESRMKSNQSTHNPVVGKEIDKMSKGTINGSLDNMSKSSNTLEFLSN